MLKRNKYDPHDFVKVIIGKPGNTNNSMLRNESFTQYIGIKGNEKKLGEFISAPSNQNYFMDACRNNLPSVAAFIIKFNPKCRKDDNDIPSIAWHVANGGFREIFFILMHFKNEINFETSADDGTTPFMIAVTKGHNYMLPLFKELFRIRGETLKYLREMLRFGKVTNEDLKYWKLLPKAGSNWDWKMVISAIRSDNQNSLRFINKIITDNNISLNILKLLTDRQSVHVRCLFKTDTHQRPSALTCMSEIFPVFNDEIEFKWTESWQDKPLDKITFNSIRSKAISKLCCKMFLEEDEPQTMRCKKSCIKRLVKYTYVN